MVRIFTDGACSGNPGIGGWGVVIIIDKKEPIFLNGGERHTTNNRMELMAAIQSILFFDEKNELEIFTDSKYLKDGIESWIYKWKQNGWKTSTKGIKNIQNLPENAKKYIFAIEDFIGAKISSVSTSPERDDTILIVNPFED